MRTWGVDMWENVPKLEACGLTSRSSPPPKIDVLNIMKHFN